jgi:hypothetical protein
MEKTLSDFSDKELLDNLFSRLGIKLPEPDQNGLIDYWGESIEGANTDIYLGGYYDLHLKIKTEDTGKISKLIIESRP